MPMQWYYAKSGNQAGPISETQIDQLIAAGQITEETLVWREGMTNWLPLSNARPAVSRSPEPAPTSVETDPDHPNAAPGHVVCAECRQLFPSENTIRHGSTFICSSCKPRFIQKLKEGLPMPQPGHQSAYGGFWIRAVAKIVDALLLGVAIMAPLVVLVLGASGQSNPTTSTLLIAIAMIVGYAIVVAYHTYCVGKWGATPGKMAMGLKIVTSQGEPVTYLRAFARYWAEQLSQTLLYIGYIIVVFDDEKRALHDHICGTRVVRK